MSDVDLIQGHFNNILDNLISSGIVWLYGVIYTGLGYGEQPQIKDVDSLLKQALEDQNYNYEWGNEEQFEQVGLFLLSPEAESMMRQIFSSKLENDLKGLEEIRRQFSIQLSLHLEVPVKNITGSANQLFEILVSGCEKAFAIAIDRGILSAHEALSAQRHNMLLDELQAVRKNLELLTARQKPDIKEILKFEDLYRKQVRSDKGYIEPPTYNTRKRPVPIDQLYVKSSFISHVSDQSEPITFDKFTSKIFRTVLIGNPGGGKSTFANKLCYDLATNTHGLGRRQLTPILVILRDFGVERKQKNWSVIQYIEAKSNELYQLPVPKYAIEYLLLNGRAMMIFDGLDELLDTNDRQEITRIIQSFCNLFPSTPILVTSREVGYDHAPLANDKFDIFKLAPLNRDQSKQYVQNFFSSDESLLFIQRKRLAEGFIEESESVPNDLISSPLLLALMCNLYRGPGTLPQNRPQIYHRCSEMLFERWDKERNIKSELPFESRIRPAMTYLAYWIYQDADLQNGVTEKKLVDKATEYLMDKQFEDEDEARTAATKFVDFCTDRAWVFTDTGTMRDGERLYQFTHRTFLEYFSASYLVRIHRTPKELLKVLLPKIRNQEWDIVAQLAFQQQSDDSENATDELFQTLLKAASKTNLDKSYSLLSFAARCLAFIVPNSIIARQISAASIRWCFEWFKTYASKNDIVQIRGMRGTDNRRVRRISDIIENLLGVQNENRVSISKAFESTIIDAISSGDEIELYAVAELSMRGIENIFYDDTNYWENLSREIITHYHKKISELVPKYPLIGIMLFFERRINIEQLIHIHGFSIMFIEAGCRFFVNKGYSAVSDMLLSRIIENDYENTNFFLEQLGILGEILTKTQPPFIESNKLLLSRPNWKRNSTLDERCNDPKILLGAFIIFATLLESRSSVAIGHPLGKYLNSIFNARFKLPSNENSLIAKLHEYAFNKDQQVFIWRWIRHEINFVEFSDPKVSTEIIDT